MGGAAGQLMGYEKGRVKKFKKSEESKVRAGARREERRESAKGGGGHGMAYSVHRC